MIHSKTCLGGGGEGPNMEERKDRVDSVAQMCNFISELHCVQRGGGGRERL